jgi:hypothetical protein
LIVVTDERMGAERLFGGNGGFHGGYGWKHLRILADRSG